MQLLFQRIISSFPQTSLRCAFAYGSSVYKQIGLASGVREMIDFIIVVDDPSLWHRENIIINPKHYSWLRFGGVKLVNQIHTCAPGPRIYFNTLVDWENHLIKYGVVSTQSLLEDLQLWRHLYLSGRLHKPVCWVGDSVDEQVKCAVKQNLKQAATIAILLLPEIFNEEELYQQICSLSYDGDFRMKFGEDKSKVNRLVWGHETRYRRLYSPLLSEIPQVDWKSAYSELLQKDDSQQGTRALLQSLPMGVIEVIRREFGGPSLAESSLLLDRLSEHHNCSEIVRGALKNIVFHSSIRQTLVNAFTAGFAKSIKYSIRKIWKMIGSN